MLLKHENSNSKKEVPRLRVCVSRLSTVKEAAKKMPLAVEPQEKNNAEPKDEFGPALRCQEAAKKLLPQNSGVDLNR